MSAISDVQPVGGSVTLNIADATAVTSAAADLLGNRLVGIVMPATWTAAVMTFQVSNDGITYQELYGSTGSAISYTVVQAHNVNVPIADFAAWQFIKVRSGTSGTAVNQSGGTNVILVAKPVK